MSLDPNSRLNCRALCRRSGRGFNCSAMAAVAAPAAAAPEITGTVKPITFDAPNLGVSHIE